MSVKFETINGQLCRMVEPEPLTPDSKFPCLVQLIQDDSPMGRYNALKGKTMIDMVWLATGQNCYTVHINGMLHDRIFCYEIIGYPVETGSAEWWWYQRVNGNKICQIHNSPLPNKRYYAIRNGDDYCAFYNNDGTEVHINTRRTYQEFIEYCDFTSQYRWQLYEPKPEPAKEPEIVAHKQHANCLVCGKEISIS